MELATVIQTANKTDGRQRGNGMMALGTNERPVAAELLGAPIVAGLLDISVDQLWKLNSAKRIPRPIQLSAKSWKWRRAELLAWIEAGAPVRDVWEAMNGA